VVRLYSVAVVAPVVVLVAEDSVVALAACPAVAVPVEAGDARCVMRDY
jgi:hypothetical protein